MDNNTYIIALFYGLIFGSIIIYLLNFNRIIIINK